MPTSRAFTASVQPLRIQGHRNVFLNTSRSSVSPADPTVRLLPADDFFHRQRREIEESNRSTHMSSARTMNSLATEELPQRRVSFQPPASSVSYGCCSDERALIISTKHSSAPCFLFSILKEGP
jgi:hypothetical protein